MIIFLGLLINNAQMLFDPSCQKLKSPLKAGVLRSKILTALKTLITVQGSWIVKSGILQSHLENRSLK